MIGKMKVNSQLPLDLRTEEGYRAFRDETIAMVKDVLQRQVDGYLPSKGRRTDLLTDVRKAVGEINHISISKMP